MDAMVTTEWLADALGGSDVKVADASYFLPDHKRDAAAEFREAHIPGAVFLDLATLADRDSSLPSMLPPAGQFAERMQALGIGRDDRIVVYDNSPLHSAARAWWMLRLYGAKEVAILDGGLAAWESEGRSVESGDPPAASLHHLGEGRGPVANAPMLDPGLRRGGHGNGAWSADGPDRSNVRTKADITANIDSGAEQLVDARSPARFSGEEPDPRPGIAHGHIPGSRDLHYTGLFHSDGSWKQGEELRLAFEEAGIDLAKPIVTTCGSGITAAVLVFGAHLLGVRAALYDGSWSEWGADPATPKATGAA